jgi:hypothetical protein
MTFLYTCAKKIGGAITLGSGIKNDPNLTFDFLLDSNATRGLYKLGSTFYNTEVITGFYNKVPKHQLRPPDQIFAKLYIFSERGHR